MKPGNGSAYSIDPMAQKALRYRSWEIWPVMVKRSRNRHAS